MNKRSPFRVMLNLVLIVIVVISVVATGFVSIRGYCSNRIPEVYSDEQIAKVVKEEYSDFEFEMDDNWDVETLLADDKKSFTADIDIIRAKDLCSTDYGVKLTFKLVDGVWKAVSLPAEITLLNNEWFFENSEWSATEPDGTKYKVSFLDNLEAELCIQESPDPAMAEETSVNALAEEMAEDETAGEEMLEDESDNDGLNTDEYNMYEGLDGSNSADIDLNGEESSEILGCRLMESDDPAFFKGIFETAYDGAVILTVTEDAVKLKLSNEGRELTLTRE
ncbi:hypothetical protein B5F53_15950 [Blautia sp. An249]|uniref:hypothetical protein n=1 Tax=Blautia sp. An249 TaxID=1965603 RepID=UPI000B375F05|nr:hypothetical protein [Blautia sp. An249]OUO76742.1 hypothetical protein B5F53_15950 [Blautia sp. An249]